MELLKEFDFNRLEDIIQGQNYSLIYLNYDKPNGIKVLHSIEELKEEDKIDFYKLYLFNDEYMVTIFNFGAGEYKYNKIEKSDFNAFQEKEIYLNDLVKEEKIRVRVGKIGGKEVVQYIGFARGDK